MMRELRRTSLQQASEPARRYCAAVDAAMREVGQRPPNWQDLFESDTLIMLYFKVPPEVSGHAGWPRALAKAIAIAEPQALPCDVTFNFYGEAGYLEDIFNVQDAVAAVRWLNGWADIAESGDRLHGRAPR